MSVCVARHTKTYYIKCTPKLDSKSRSFYQMFAPRVRSVIRQIHVGAFYVVYLVSTLPFFSSQYEIGSSSVPCLLHTWVRICACFSVVPTHSYGKGLLQSIAYSTLVQPVLLLEQVPQLGLQSK